MTGDTRTAREIYRAYLRGEVTTEEIDQRGREMNAALKLGNRFPSRDDKSDDASKR